MRLNLSSDLLSAVMMLTLVFMCLPFSTQKLILRTWFTGGLIIDEEGTATARLGGYRIKNWQIEKTPLQNWQRSLAGFLYGVLVTSLLLAGG